MAYIESDNVKLRENGLEILKEVHHLKEIVNLYYSRIEKMPTITCEWMGSSANRFSQKILSSKNNAISFCEMLESYGNFFLNSADQIDKKIKNNSL